MTASGTTKVHPTEGGDTTYARGWGPEARDVQFILKRVSCKKVSRPRTKVKRTNSKLIKQLAELEQKHPKYAGSDSDSEVVNMQGNIQVSTTTKLQG